MLKDRENGIDHRGVPSSLSGSRYTPSLRTRVAIERGNAHREGDAIHRRCVRVSLSRSPLSLSMTSPRFAFGRIFRPVPISSTLNLPISATLNIARKGYPFQYFSRDRLSRLSLSRSPLSLSLSTRVAVAVSFVVVDGVAQIYFRTNISTRSYLSHVKSPHLRHVKYRA